jgi:hypothetical protein
VAGRAASTGGRMYRSSKLLTVHTVPQGHEIEMTFEVRLACPAEGARTHGTTDYEAVIARSTGTDAFGWTAVSGRETNDDLRDPKHGRPARQHQAAHAHPLTEVVHEERFGGQWQAFTTKPLNHDQDSTWSDRPSLVAVSVSWE